MHDPTDVIEPILREAKRTLGEMKKSKDLNDRKHQSEIVNNLCQSLGVFFDMVSNTLPELDLSEEESE